MNHKPLRDLLRDSTAANTWLTPSEMATGLRGRGMRVMLIDVSEWLIELSRSPRFTLARRLRGGSLEKEYQLYDKGTDAAHQ